MAKKKEETKKAEIGTKTPKSKDKSKDKSVISIRKYLQLHGSDIHKYSRAYLEVQFHGILKEKEAWKEEINKVMEGDK